MNAQFSFVGGEHGPWRVTTVRTVYGEPLAPAAALDVVSTTSHAVAPAGTWTLRGFMSNVRYAERAEVSALRAKQAALGRDSARFAALIPIRKSQAWWALAQDERRAVFEARSHHTAIGMEYLPAIARQLYHSRDLGEPFDFLTWFEFAPSDEAAFDELLARLRASEEWRYVEREVEIRLERALPMPMASPSSA